MELKYLSDLKFKADDQGVIEGYGSVFDTVDNGGDIVAPGAFGNSLRSGRKVKMLMQHDSASIPGVWDEISEDERGLRVKGRLLTKIGKGAEAYELVKAGALDGLSIGYRTIKSMDRNGRRVIMQADLWEVSLVTFPMNEMARIDAVKAADMDRDEIERLLTLRAGLSRSVARKLLASGYEGIKDMRGAVDGADELAALLRQRATL
jgi:HK97 family phage prohead protease